MAVKTLNTRLKLKYAPRTEWEGKNPVLLAGEVAIATITGADGAEVQSPLIKVGDGVSNYNSLGYLYAKAMDVAAWAKAATKPTYNGTEIKVDGDAAAKSVAEVIKALEAAVALKASQADLESLANLVGVLPEGTEATTIVDYVNKKTAGIATDAALEELNNQVGALQTSVQGILGDYLKAADKTELANAISTEQSRAEGVEAGLETRLATVEADYLKTADKYNDAALVARVQAIEDDYLKEADKYNDAEVRGLISDNADAIDAIEADYLKAVDKTALQEAIALKADETALQAEIDRAKAAEKVNADAIALLTNGVSAEEVDGVNDLIQYVKDHGAEVTGIKADIKTNAQDIDALEGRMDDAEAALGTVDSRIEAAIAGADLSKYALDADLDAAVERVAALESADGVQDGLLAGLRTDVDAKAAQADLLLVDERVAALEDAEHQNAEQVGAAIDAKITALDLANVYEAKGAAADALADAKEYADGLAVDYDAAGSAAQALVDAKAYTDGKDTAMNARVAALEEKEFVLYTDELIIDCGGAEI